MLNFRLAQILSRRGSASRITRRIESAVAATRPAEVLDARTMLSGDVTATFAGGLLQITGDADANRLDATVEVQTVTLVDMSTVDRYFLVFTTDAGTTVNGMAADMADLELTDAGTPLELTGLIVTAGSGDDVLSIDLTNDDGSGPVSTSIGIVGANAQLGDGDDTFALTGFNTLDRVAIRGGNDDDKITVDGTAGLLELFGEVGHDDLTVAGTIDEAEIVGGDGTDDIIVSASVTQLTVTDDVGADRVTLSGTIANATVDTGVGQDWVDISGDVTSVTVMTGGGVDEVYLSGTVGSANVITSTGDDFLTVSGTVTTLTARTGGGLDTVTLEETAAVDGAEVNTGGDDDTVLVYGDSIGLLHFITANGNDSVTVGEESLIQALKVWSGNGADEVFAFGIFEEMRLCTGADQDTVVFTGTVTATTRIFTDGGGDVVRLAQEPIPETAFGTIIDYDKAEAAMFGSVRINTGDGADTLIASAEFDDADESTENEFSNARLETTDVVFNGGPSDLDELIVSDALAADLVVLSRNFELPAELLAPASSTTV